MARKLAYVTKKQVNEFIEWNLRHTFNSVQEFIDELNIVLDDLNEFPDDSLNQKKFYNRVKESLVVTN